MAVPNTKVVHVEIIPMLYFYQIEYPIKVSLLQNTISQREMKRRNNIYLRERKFLGWLLFSRWQFVCAAAESRRSDSEWEEAKELYNMLWWKDGAHNFSQPKRTFRAASRKNIPYHRPNIMFLSQCAITPATKKSGVTTRRVNFARKTISHFGLSHSITSKLFRYYSPGGAVGICYPTKYGYKFQHFKSINSFHFASRMICDPGVFIYDHDANVTNHIDNNNG